MSDTNVSAAIFSILYHPWKTGVTRTIAERKQVWPGEYHVVYPPNSDYTPQSNEYPGRAVSWPFHDQAKMGLPFVPSDLPETDVCHTHTQWGFGYAGLRYARKHDVPVITTSHSDLDMLADDLTSDSVFGNLTAKLLIDEYLPWYYTEVDAVIVPSQYMKNHLRTKIPSLPERNIEVIPNGVNTTRFAPANPDPFLDEYELDADCTYVGYLGRLNGGKNVEELIRASEGIEYPILIGGTGPLRSELEALAREVDSDVTFLGKVPEDLLSNYYSSLAAFVLPSTVETEGLVLKEAVACATPVVGADTGAIPELFDEPLPGMLYQSGDHTDLQRTVAEVVADREMYAENCRDHRESISIQYGTEQVRSVVQELKEGH
jgi:glycosyltransferase involved in cell wall biosynthesis